MGQNNMQAICLKCHTKPTVDEFYEGAEDVLHATNKRVKEAKQIMDRLYADNILTDEPFDEPIEFLYFDYWHYYGRTAKHGAFMGGADFVQWHGNYELVRKMVKLKEQANKLREKHGKSQSAHPSTQPAADTAESSAATQPSPSGGAY
jgi:hypothetical protein